ncbi:MAG TPA: 2-isopropylmalate synthase, partial [Gammaproteobacteria bacterium]|nr:2-isopropylmalate synthase [Gammaproteobacteria bacterium]
KFHGEGVYLWKNGDKYVGLFRDGKKHGAGTLHTESGTINQTWKNGRKITESRISQR